MVKPLAIIANLSTLGVWIYFSISEGLRNTDVSDILFLMLIFSTPILSLVALFWSAGIADEESTFSLMRKAIRAKLRKIADD